jgi:hypothetical protein
LNADLARKERQKPTWRFRFTCQPDRQLGAKGYSPEEVAKFQETCGGFQELAAQRAKL